MKKAVLCAFILMSTQAHAQLSITPVAGLNVSNYRVTSDILPMEPNNLRFGLCAGVLAGIPVTAQLSLQPGVLYKMNGFRWNTDQVKQIETVNTIEVPVKLVCSFNSAKGRFFVGAGPYAAINLSGQNHIEGNVTFDSTMTLHPVDQTTKIDIGPKHLQRFDIGAGMNVGFEATKGLFICAQGQYGLTDLAPAGATTHLHNYNFGVVAGYSFKMKKQKPPTSTK